MNRPMAYAERVEALVAACHAMRPGVPALSPSEFLARSGEGAWVIVDVRSVEEREVSIIPGAIDKAAFEARLNEHANQNVLVYCTVGCRSGKYAETLRRSGLSAFNLWGGVLAWALEGEIFVDPDGEPTRRVHVHGDRWNVLPPGYEAVT